MKILNHNNINFQKKLRAKASVLKNGKSVPVKIFELDKTKDIKELGKCYKQDIWQDNCYLENIYDKFLGRTPDEKYYTMQNKDGDILCIAVTADGIKSNNLFYIETAPKLSTYQKNARKYKFIGETMVTFLAKLCKKEEKDLIVKFVRDEAPTENFYYIQCGMDKYGYDDAKLEYSQIGGLVSGNKKHTGSKIKLKNH